MNEIAYTILTEDIAERLDVDSNEYRLMSLYAQGYYPEIKLGEGVINQEIGSQIDPSVALRGMLISFVKDNLANPDRFVWVIRTAHLHEYNKTNE